MPKRYPFLFKGNFAKTSRQSFEVDHPPKRKKPWRHSTFLGMEMSHFSNSLPWGGRRTTSPGDGCAGRVLRPLSQVAWESGEGGLPKDGDVKEFQARVSGAVGNVTYSMDPFWSEVNENGDVATIDPLTGLIALEEDICQGPYPPWIIYQVCDDCGCSSGTIWLEDSSGDCDPCPGCDCEDTGADCYAECCDYTEDGDFEEITAGGTKQYTCSGGGEWSVVGEGLSISVDGLLSADVDDACGTGTVTNSVCGDKTVRVQGNGSVWSTPAETICFKSSGVPTFLCMVINGGTRLNYGVACGTSPCTNPPFNCAQVGDCEASIPGGCGGSAVCARYITRQFWVCPP